MNSLEDKGAGLLAPPAIAEQDPKDTAQEAVHEVMPKAAAKKILIPQERPDTAPGAAKGDDDLMSKPQQPSTPSADDLKGKWKQRVGAARLTWDRLTEDELHKTEGHIERLVALVQQRYALAREEAEMQINRFFGTQRF